MMIGVSYAKSWMILDILSLIPCSFFGNPNNEYFLRLFRVFKMGRLFDFVNIYKTANVSINHFYKEESIEKIKKKMLIIYGWQMLLQVLKMLFTTYFLACVWYYYVDLLARKNYDTIDFKAKFDLYFDKPYKIFIKIWY